MSPFRIRERLRALLGREPSIASDPIPPPRAPSPSPAAQPRPEVSVSMHGNGATETAPAAAAAGPPGGAAAAPAAPDPAPPTAAGPSEAELAKQKKHWERTRKGMLKWLSEQGGSATMKDMHDRAEARYFVAHRAFSRLMEEFTGQGLVDYSSTTGMVVLTDAGRAELG